MSEATASSTEIREVYVPLLEEGTDVYRPTRAIPRGAMRFELLAVDDDDPEDEAWQFPPGSTVDCRSERIGGRDVIVARTLVGRFPEGDR